MKLGYRTVIERPDGAMETAVRSLHLASSLVRVSCIAEEA
jgi:hypothetical protein